MCSLRRYVCSLRRYVCSLRRYVCRLRRYVCSLRRYVYAVHPALGGDARSRMHIKEGRRFTPIFRPVTFLVAFGIVLVDCVQ